MKKYKRILLTLALGVSLSSCLDFDPKDQLADGNVWTEANNFKYFANNFYGWTRDFSNALYDAPHCDTRSDLVISNNVNQFSHGNNSLTTSDANYTDGYKRIRRVNLLLQNAQSYGGTYSEIATYVGEAYFFRAYIYFDLVQLFGDVIWLDHPVSEDSPEMNAPRDSRSVIVKNIIEDLEKATELLPEQPAEKGRLGKMTAQAFLSRVALYEGTWQKFRGNNANELLDKAAKAAKNVIDSEQYELFAPASLGTEAYRYMFILEDVQSTPDKSLTKASNKEYIFVRNHEEVLSPVGKNVTHTYLNNEALCLTRKLANMYLCSDGLPIGKSGQSPSYKKIDSEYQNRDNRMTATMIKPGGTYYKANRTKWDDTDVPANITLTKVSGYHNRKWAAERTVETAKEGYDYPVIRYAEILLNYAEAVYERDGQISNDDLNISLNLVRLRSNPAMPKLSNELVSAHGLDMQEEIRRERTVELIHEGFRIDDLKRWKTAEVEMPMDILGIQHTGTDWATQWNTSQTTNEEGCLILETGRQWATRNYLLPLPSDQRQLNPNIGQNPGWE